MRRGPEFAVGPLPGRINRSISNPPNLAKGTQSSHRYFALKIYCTSGTALNAAVTVGHDTVLTLKGFSCTIYSTMC